MERVSAASKRLGFTLIELLVVVSIIALLVSILLPSLGRAREQAKAVLCANNVRQLGMAWIYYANDNTDWFPIGMYWEEGMAWWKSGHGVEEYLPTKTAFQDKNATENNTYEGWYCPKNARKAIDSSLAVGYQFNFNVGYMRYTNQAKVRQPGTTPLLFGFWDSTPGTPPNLLMGNYFSRPTDPMTDEETYASYHFIAGIRDVHAGLGTNFHFADGHVERVTPMLDQTDYAKKFTWEISPYAIRYVTAKPTSPW